ncbi:hypothetical protein ScPMuIL_012046 [Solemya velum]
MADWEEVKRLAADFQRAQLSSTKQKLSERNVIEIVSKLIGLKLIEVVYTLDGKEYLTPQELAKEIKEELFVHGGRINLVELQQILNVDFSHVESKVTEIIKHDKNLTLVLGQLIDKSYLDRFAEELYDLPADFLSENVHERLGSVIKGQVDSYDNDVIFTEAFVARTRARIRGAFSAITRPTAVMAILSQYDFQERLFYSILEELNGYLEYDAMNRLGITDPKGFIKKRYKSEKPIFLSTCCSGRAIQDQIEASVEEALSTGAWTDIMPLVPTIFSTSDVNQLLTNCVSGNHEAVVCCDTMVVSRKFISNCNKPFASLMADKAEKDAKKNVSILSTQGGKGSHVKLSGMDDGSSGRDDKKEGRKKKVATCTKSGGGTQGREVKMKSTKKKYRARDQDDDSDDGGAQAIPKGREPELEFMSIDEITAVLRTEKDLEECPEEMLTEIATTLQRPLNREYQEVAKSIFLQSAGVATGRLVEKHTVNCRRKSTALTNAILFEKGIKQSLGDSSSSGEAPTEDSVHRSDEHGGQCYKATDHMVSLAEDTQLTSEGRAKVINRFQKKKKNWRVSKPNLTWCVIRTPGVPLKKPDKKKEGK